MRVTNQTIRMAELLKLAVELDEDYPRRYRLVFDLLHEAILLGYAAGVRIDPDDPEWPVAFIELPTGQVSWHLPQHETPWDGHTTPEKFQRIERYVEEYGE